MDIITLGMTPAEAAAAWAPYWRAEFDCNVCVSTISATANDLYKTPTDYLSTYLPGSRVANRLYRYSTICPVCSTVHWIVDVPKPIADYVGGIIPPIVITGPPTPLVLTGGEPVVV
jgi:hypothetical protein